MILFSGQTILWTCSAFRMDEAGNVSWGKIARKPDGIYPGWRLLNKPLVPVKSNRADGSGFDITAWVSAESLKDGDEGQQVDETYLNRQLEAFLEKIVSNINIRNFSYESDLPLAFDGIAFYLAQTASPKTLFSKGLSWGLPLAHFLYSLTWSTDGEDLRPRGSESQFPSWSWFSWEGAITATRESHHSAFGFSQLSIAKPICDYSFIENPRVSMDLQPTSKDQGGRYVRIVGEKFVSKSTKWHLDAYGFYFIDDVWPFRYGILYPDQLVDFGEEQSIELLGITIFEGVSDDKTMKTITFVKALWIARGKGGSASLPDLYYRRGVAIIQQELWDRHTINEDVRSTVILA